MRAILLTLLLAAPLGAQSSAPRYDPATYVQQSHDIPMRDELDLERPLEP